MDISSLQLVLDWNRDDERLLYKPPLHGETVADTFQALAGRTPNAPAIITETNEELCYAAVLAKASTISQRVSGGDSDVTSSTSARLTTVPCVLVALPRCTALPIALLAVVKSQSAYWAVDLTLQSPLVVLQNAERLGCRYAIVDDATLQLLRAAAASTRDKHFVSTVTWVVVDPRTGDLIAQKRLPLQQPFDAHRSDAAFDITCPLGTMYIEFTSGSTGQPKAVAVPHSSCIALCRNSAAVFEWSHTASPHVRSVLYHTVAFDVHVFDLWGPWMHGGAVVTLEGSVTDVAMVLERCRSAKATHLSMTPFGFSMLTKLHFAEGTSTPHKAGGSCLCSHLKMVMLCGEALEFHSLDPWFDHAAAIGERPPRFYNSYGITETTVINTYLEVTASRRDWPSSIGRRLPHTVMLLLDEHGEALVQHGDVGELYLAGDCLASGYITSLEKNDSSFVPIPKWLQPALHLVAPSMSLRTSTETSAALMYKSGDLASFCDEFGGFVYKGRADAEIKSAGFRVHPLEVEGHLHHIPLVREAVVVAATQPDGKVVLFAFVRSRGKVHKVELLTELRKVVADYKIPIMYFLDDNDIIPLSATNKVERKRLAAWATETLGLGGVDALPRRPLPESVN